MHNLTLFFKKYINILLTSILTLCLGGGKEIEWNGKKKYFKNIFSFPLFGSLSRREWKGMKRSFPCLGV